ncbi:MAG: hypothetical protein U0791_02810 [Gemmataceae bacterium]
MFRKLSRKLILGAVAVVGLTANSGCLINQYSSEPDRRMQQLLYQSEDLRQIGQEWRPILVQRPTRPPDARTHPRRHHLTD